MRITDWLIRLDPQGLYDESVLEELEAYGIRYRYGVLTSALSGDLPYISYGRTSHVPFMTARELVTTASRMGYSIEIDHTVDRLRVPGYEITTSVWRLLRPITVEHPPSEVTTNPRRKAALDIQALQRYGY